MAVGDEGAPEHAIPADAALPQRRMSVGGRGLAIVSQLAQRWGVEPLASGKRVWFERSFDADGAR